MQNLDAMLLAVKKSEFNSSKWMPSGDPVNLKDLWAAAHPGLYETIKGTEIPVTENVFEDGRSKKAIAVPCKDGVIELTLASTSPLKDGDLVELSSIEAQLLKKVGEKDIIRYNATAVAV